MNKSAPSLAEICVVIFCLWMSRELLSSWFDSPYLYGGWIAFLIWLFPLVVYWFLPSETKKSSTPALVGAGLAVTVIGLLGSLNTFIYIGLALALGGLLPFSFGWLPWWVTSALWMPATAYFLKMLPLEIMPTLRLVTALIGAVWGAFWAFIMLRK